MIKVFKFGGASVKDAEGVRNVAGIFRLYPGEKILAVISAMGKTTNTLEVLLHAYCSGKGEVQELLHGIKQFHLRIMNDLFPGKNHPVYDQVNNFFTEIEWVLEEKPGKNYDFLYDQIVPVGEFISSAIVSAYLGTSGINNRWVDVRDCIRTDDTYREAKVNWEATAARVQDIIPPLFTPEVNTLVTQGFTGCTPENNTTTLGREGSDYSAAIFAFCLDVSEVTIWKDVPGVLNADPKRYPAAVKIDRLSYFDAIELAYYGATVIHPKTIKPLQNKKIPLRVKSFASPSEPGTLIDVEEFPLTVPCFIFKPGQLLATLSPKDFSFIVEENLSEIFRLFALHRIKINVMQNSALSFSVCMDDDGSRIPALVRDLQKQFKVRYNRGMELVTVRHYTQAAIDNCTAGKEILLEQKSRHTAQFVMRAPQPV